MKLTIKRSVRERILLALVAVATVIVFTFVSTQAAEAAVYRYKVISKSSTADVTGPKVIASCKVTTTGGKCAISSGKTATRTIQLSLGASRGDVSAGLNISSATSVSTTVGCHSPALRAGQIWKARALGTKYSYRLQKQQAYKPRIGPTSWKTVGTSGFLTAYNPYRSGISCGL